VQKHGKNENEKEESTNSIQEKQDCQKQHAWPCSGQETSQANANMD
jgi:hypothetical protein